MSFEYQQYTPDQIDSDDAKVQAITAGIYADLVEGENAFRFLPAAPGKKPLRITALHYIDQVGS